MIYKICAILITLAIVLGVTAFVIEISYSVDEQYVDDHPLSGCWEEGSIVVIPVFGEIAWGLHDESSLYGYGLSGILEEVRDNDWYGGVVLDIDSPGGYPVASIRLAEIVHEIAVPSVSVVGDLGTSGGYLVASAADRVTANPVSDVGSIGVTMSYVSEAEANQLSGLNYESLSTGDYKDVGDPARSLSDEERDFLRQNLQFTHDHFVSLVAQYRGLDAETVSGLADGKWYAGAEAVKLDLIDGLGDVDEAIEHIRQETGQNNPVCYAPVL